MIGIYDEINEPGSPLLATAIHNGHSIRQEIGRYLEIDEYTRLREEDPYTEYLAGVSGNRITVDTSRFEVDVNRPRDEAVYRTPEQAWGLKVWKDNVPPALWETSLGEYDHFYNLLERVVTRIINNWGYIIVYDIHSYNYLRNGSDKEEADPAANPEVNVGTASLNRNLWGPVVDNFIKAMEEYKYQGRKLQVAENIRFKGGYLGKWIHSRFPGKSCVLSIEFKKIFMDEWTGAVDIVLIKELRNALKGTIEYVLKAAEEVKARQV